MDSTEIEFLIRKRAEGIVSGVYKNPSDFSLLAETQVLIKLLQSLPIEINFWYMQNIYYKMAKTVYREVLQKAKSGDENAARWCGSFQADWTGYVFLCRSRPSQRISLSF